METWWKIGAGIDRASRVSIPPTLILGSPPESTHLNFRDKDEASSSGTAGPYLKVWREEIKWRAFF